MLLSIGMMAALPALASDPPPAPADANDQAGDPAGTTAATTSRPDQWRYVWHNNQWWYFKPSGKWLIFNGHDWQTQEVVVAANGRVSRSYQPAYRSNNNSSSSSKNRPYMSNQRGTKDPLDDYGPWGNGPRYWTYQHVIRGN
jgi:hypothetical protein